MWTEAKRWSADIWNFVFFMIGADPTGTKWTLIFSVADDGFFSLDSESDGDIVDVRLSAISCPINWLKGSIGRFRSSPSLALSLAFLDDLNCRMGITKPEGLSAIVRSALGQVVTTSAEEKENDSFLQSTELAFISEFFSAIFFTSLNYLWNLDRTCSKERTLFITIYSLHTQG